MIFYVQKYFTELKNLLFEMAPWLLLGFLIAGILHVFFPDGKINRLLGKSNLRSVVRAALIGVPLPLCSCGVIPTGISIYKNGASKGASVSFLISTPQTGVDSIMVTYSLLGLPFAIIRPIVAFLTGIFGGFITNAAFKNDPKQADEYQISATDKTIKNPFVEIFRYAFVDFLQDIAKWLIIGLLIAALIGTFVPNDFFASYIHNDFLGMLIILAISIPVYICATSSVPIAAALMLKGISPGAALVFLMAGPASNAATIAVIGKSMGKKTLFIYLFTLVFGSLFFGIFIDYFLPREWFSLSSQAHLNHQHDLLPNWLSVGSGILTVLLLANIYLRRFYLKKNNKEIILNNNNSMESSVQVFVRGMNCSHCKMNVENNLSRLQGIQTVQVDLEKELVTLQGDNIDLEKVKATVENIGYRYEEIAS